MILYLKNPKNSTKKNLLEIINIFGRIAGYNKINLEKSVAFLFTNNEQTEKEYRKIILFTIALKKKLPRNKLNKGCERPTVKTINHQRKKSKKTTEDRSPVLMDW
jgi:hypothetical protein